jgi:alcohol dehydrogenase class IV
MSQYETKRSSFQFGSVEKMLMGENSIRSLGSCLKNLKVKRVLVITDSNLVKAGVVENVLEPLRVESIAFEVYDRVRPDPPILNVEEGTRLAKEGHFEAVLGVGGGSSMDVAKSVALMAANPGSLRDYLGIFRPVPERPLPIILVPTTAGTGSEASFGSVLVDEDGGHVKVQIYNYAIIARVAIVDPVMMMGMPPYVTAVTGLDALTHAIESYVNKNNNPYSDALSSQAIRLIGKGLLPAYRNGRDMKARTRMAIGSTLAGMAMSSSGLGINHALAHPVNNRYNVPHGLANGMLLPYTMVYNADFAPERYADIAELLGEDIQDLSPLEAALKGARRVASFNQEMKIPLSLKEIGVKGEDLFPVAQEVLKLYPQLVIFNPKSMNVVEAHGLYKLALEGQEIWAEREEPSGAKLPFRFPLVGG